MNLYVASDAVKQRVRIRALTSKAGCLRLESTSGRIVYHDVSNGSAERGIVVMPATLVYCINLVRDSLT